MAGLPSNPPLVSQLKKEKYKFNKLLDNTLSGKSGVTSSKNLLNFNRYSGVDAFTAHKRLINNYCLFYKGSTNKFKRDDSKDKNDYDIIRENHRFLWNEKDLAEAEKNWDASLAKKYYDRLFKEYCISDLSQYKKNLYAMRWRVEKEVFSGKGQFECGNKHCSNCEDLSSWEVNFTYVEFDERKNALVKLRLCPECSVKLNYHSKKRLVNKKQKVTKRNKTKRSKKNRPDSRLSEEESSSSSQDTMSGSNVTQKKQRTEELQKDIKPEPSVQASSVSDIWRGKSSALIDAKKTLNDELDEFIDDLLL